MTDQRDVQISDEELARFDTDGYLVLRNRFPAATVDRLRRASDSWGADAVARRRRGEVTHDCCLVEQQGELFPIRIERLHLLGGADTLDLLASPQVLGLADQLCDSDPIPTLESLILRHARDKQEIPWHQPSVYTRAERAFAVSLSLDESTGADAARLLPGSHCEWCDICALWDAHGWDPPGLARVELHPGDVLVTDLMLVQGSPRRQAEEAHRAVVFELWSKRQAVQHGPWSERWIAARRELLELARNQARGAGGQAVAGAGGEPAAAPDLWTELASLYAHREPGPVANHCIRVDGRAVGHTVRRP